MGDITKPNVASVINQNDGTAICTTSALGKEQVFRQPTTGTSYNMGTQIVCEGKIEQNNRMLDDIGFRYNIQNNHAASNCYIYNGMWPLIDKMEVRVNGAIIGDFPFGSVNLMELMKYNNYESFSRFISERPGTFFQTAGVDQNEVTPGNFKFAVVNGQSPRFESYLSEVLKCLYKIHVKYVRTFQIIFYLKSATAANPHKILGFDNGFTLANLSLQNFEMVMYFTKYKPEQLPVNIVPKLSFYEEFYEDRIFDVTAFAGQQTTLDIRLDTNYRSFLNIKKIFYWTDNTAVNGTHTVDSSYNVYNATDIVQIEILNNGVRYALFDSQRALLIHQNKYHKRRSRRRISNWLTFSQMNQIPNSFIDCDRNDIVISNDGHFKTNFLSGWSNDVNLNGEWRLRVTGNWSALRPNFHLCLEVAHIVNLFSNPDSTNYFEQ